MDDEPLLRFGPGGTYTRDVYSLSSGEKLGGCAWFWILLGVLVWMIREC